MTSERALNVPGDLLTTLPSSQLGRRLQQKTDKKDPIQARRISCRACRVRRGLFKVSQAAFAPGFSLDEARIATVAGGESGVLVWKFGQLVAILTQIDEEAYSTKGKWFLETGFGLLSGLHKNFDTIEEAVSWVGQHTFPDLIRSSD